MFTTCHSSLPQYFPGLSISRFEDGPERWSGSASILRLAAVER